MNSTLRNWHNRSCIITRDLSVGYSADVLSNVNLEVRRGEAVAILGPNGSGKTTLLKTIATILKPLKGVVYVDGKDAFRMSAGELARRLSVTLTERIDAGYMTGFEVVALGRYPYLDAFGNLSKEDEDVVMECLKLVNALNLKDKPFLEMSDGERQKIMIARALAQKPEVILLDEPTSFLDAKHRIEIMLLLRKIAENGVAVLLTTHDVELALRLCDKVILVSKGRVVVHGEPEDVLNSRTLREVYGSDRAVFVESTGAFELTCRGDAKVHVVCGGGSGVKVMRALARRGIPFTAGVLHEGDMDFFIAQSCAKQCVVERAFEKISEEKLELAKKLVRGKVIIDTGFPVGELNERNLELIDLAERVLSLREMSVKDVLEALEGLLRQA